jgi:hypothetical protein
MMKTATVMGITNVHAWAFSNRLQALKHLDRRRAIALLKLGVDVGL